MLYTKHNDSKNTQKLSSSQTQLVLYKGAIHDKKKFVSFVEITIEEFHEKVRRHYIKDKFCDTMLTEPQPGFTVENGLIYMKSSIPDLKTLLQNLKHIDSILLTNRQKSQLQQKFHADKYLEHVTFEVGELLLLDREALPNWSAYQESTKQSLLPRRLGPFTIEKVEGLNYTLQLPPKLRNHPVFHVSKLTKYHPPDGSRATYNWVADLIDGEYEYEVHKILDKRKKHRRTEYLVLYKNRPLEDASWEPQSHLTNCIESIEEYEKQIVASIGPGNHLVRKSNE